MTFDPRTNKITLTGTAPDEFVLDMILFQTRVMSDLSKNENASQRIKQDALTLKNWLGEDLDNLSANGTKKLQDAFLAYLSIGAAPSFDLHDLFKSFSSKKNASEHIHNKPPNEIISVFDRMFASDEEIQKKKEADYAAHKQKLAELFDKKDIVKNHAPVSQKKRFSGDRQKYLFISLVWVLWVILRTSTDFELVGYHFDNWDEDMFFINALIVPAALLIFVWWKNRDE